MFIFNFKINWSLMTQCVSCDGCTNFISKMAGKRKRVVNCKKRKGSRKCIEENISNISDGNENINEEDEDTEVTDGDEGWTIAKEEKLIELYWERPWMYDLTDDGHSNKYKRAKTLEKISEILNMSVEAIQTRLSSLRTAYGRHKKIPKSGSGAKKLTPRQQFILTRMAFIDDHVKSRDSRSSFNPPPKDDSPIMQQTREQEGGDTQPSQQKEDENIPPSGTTSKKSDKDRCDNDPEIINDNDDSFVITPPRPSTSGENLPKSSASKEVGKKSKNEMSTLQTLEQINAQVNAKTKNKGKGKNSNKETLSSIMEERNKFFLEMATVISKPKPQVSSTPEKVDDCKIIEEKPDDPAELWCKILYTKIQRMDPNVKEDFMLEVDNIALSAIRGKWPNYTNTSGPPAAQGVNPNATYHCNLENCSNTDAISCHSNGRPDGSVSSMIRSSSPFVYGNFNSYEDY